jgi:hypothetical protein
MKLFDKAKEAVRDKTRDKLCDALQRIGVDASIVELGTKEEKATIPRGLSSLGLIEIKKRPISFAHVLYSQSQYGRDYFTVYLIHAPSVSSRGCLKARSKLVKERPVIGKVIDVIWQGDLEENITEHLNEDQYLKQELIRLRCNVKLHTCPDIGYCVIEAWGGSGTFRERWDIYEVIAHHLRQS